MLLTLPDEILLKILWCVRRLPHFLGYTMKRDILSCRLVCRRLSRVGEDIVFEDIILAPDRRGFQAFLDLSSSSLRHKLRDLRCFFEVFDPRLTTSIDLFAAEVKRLQPRRFSSTMISDGSEDLRSDFEAYLEGVCRQTLLEQGMSDTPIFALALSRLENLQSVTLSQTYEHSRHNEPDIGEYEPPDVTLSPVGHKFFEALIDALSQRQGHIEDLTLGCLSEEYYPSMDAPSLVGVIRRLNPASYRRYQEAFRNLKRLAIALPWTMGENKELNYSGLSAPIRSATALEGLCLTFDCETLDFLPIDFILSIHAPNLSTLILENVTFQEPRHLLVLLRVHASNLAISSFVLPCTRTRLLATSTFRDAEFLKPRVVYYRWLLCRN
ncbi:hypothetical protein GGR55DRAFT_76562 [Xylaria sp. FL0064]|nr:hypothetical protein GGR55DRAFT_76562 [Xylaria sp. FL0064]